MLTADRSGDIAPSVDVRMSAQSQNRKSPQARATSVLSPETDILQRGRHVSKFGSRPLSFDHLVGSSEDGRGQLNTQGFGDPEIDP